MKEFAYRNLRLCTKDCICLYVCPTGASDTENSIIDREKCIGCGACAKACPSKAISMVPTGYPPQQKKDERVTALANQLIKSKSEQEKLAEKIAADAESDGLYRLGAGPCKVQPPGSRRYQQGVRLYASPEQKYP